MFGFSLGKLLFTVFIVGAVWYGFKWIGRLQSRQGSDARVGRGPGGQGRAQPSEAPQPVEAQDMVKCSVCSDYVAAGAAGAAGVAVECQRADCPYPR